MSTFAYIREQPRARSSVEIQFEAIRVFAEGRGLAEPTLIVERSEPSTDKWHQRERLSRALEPDDVVIASTLDRIVEDSLDAWMLIEGFRHSRARLYVADVSHEITDPDTSELLLTVMFATERALGETRGRRIRESKEDQQEKGRFRGGDVPFGFKLDADGQSKQLVPDEKQQAAIRKAFALRAKGFSLRRIANHLQADGHEISHSSLARILASKPRK